MILDPHVHTLYSIDGYATPRDMARIADKRGVIIAVTDHNTIKGSLRASSLSENILCGMEVSSREGHIVALGIKEEVKKGMSAEETLDRIHELGGVAIAAHPFRLREGMGKKVNNRFDGIEVLNARSNEKSNARARKHATSLNIAMMGGSDAHLVEHICSGYTRFDGESAEDALEAIRKKKTEPHGKELDRTVIAELKFINFLILAEKMAGLRNGQNI
jgi:hypothetical protein